MKELDYLFGFIVSSFFAFLLFWMHHVHYENSRSWSAIGHVNEFCHLLIIMSFMRTRRPYIPSFFMQLRLVLRKFIEVIDFAKHAKKRKCLEMTFIMPRCWLTTHWLCGACWVSLNIYLMCISKSWTFSRIFNICYHHFHNWIG